MRDFISEDDLSTFEGWLKYQGIDAATTTPDELATWRDMFDEARERSSATPKVGLMKLRRVPGEHRYAVALREGSDLWLTLWVRRSPKGEFFVMTPRGDRGWDPHSRSLWRLRRVSTPWVMLAPCGDRDSVDFFVVRALDEMHHAAPPCQIAGFAQSVFL
jgi:hypothetical protein